MLFRCVSIFFQYCLGFCLFSMLSVLLSISNCKRAFFNAFFFQCDCFLQCHSVLFSMSAVLSPMGRVFSNARRFFVSAQPGNRATARARLRAFFLNATSGRMPPTSVSVEAGPNATPKKPRKGLAGTLKRLAGDNPKMQPRATIPRTGGHPSQELAGESLCNARMWLQRLSCCVLLNSMGARASALAPTLVKQDLGWRPGLVFPKAPWPPERVKPRRLGMFMSRRAWEIPCRGGESPT